MAGFWSRASRNEFELWVAALLGLAGYGSAVLHKTDPEAQSIPVLLQQVWGWTLLIGGILIFVGAFWPDEEDGYWAELAGMVALTVVTALFGAALIVYDVPEAGTNAFIIFSLSLTCAVRAAKIARKIWPSQKTHELRVIEKVKKLVAEQAEEKITDQQEKNGEAT